MRTVTVRAAAHRDAPCLRHDIAFNLHFACHDTVSETYTAERALLDLEQFS